MRDKLTWQVFAVVICSVIIAKGIYLGLRDSQPQANQLWRDYLRLFKRNLYVQYQGEMK